MSELDAFYKRSPELFPKSVAIAMDGNRRWARARGLAEIEGHRTATGTIKPIIKRAAELGVRQITFWIFSTENFTRTKSFIDDIFTLAREYLENGELFREITELGGRVEVVGDLSLFPRDISEKVKEYVRESRPKDQKIVVRFAMGYGGKAEIVRAVKRIIEKKTPPSEVSEELFSKNLDVQEDIDLLIRTGGRVRTSGLYIWQAVYAELYFTDVLCPDFGVAEFEKAVLEFTSRIRNFGR